MHIRLAACLTLLCAEALAADSIYTKIDLERDCKQIETDEVGASARCKGYKDYPVHFAEGDLRQSIFYGYVGSWFDEGAFESFSRFNHAGETIEWRVDKSVPYATIRRWFVSSGEDDSGRQRPDAQVLVVSRVGQKADGEACVVGYVEATANANANDIARKVADERARDFLCRRDQPQWHGVRKDAELSEMRVFGE